MDSDLGSTNGPLSRAFAVLDYVASRDKPVQISDIVADLEIAPPTAHRLAVNLEERGLLQRALGSRKLVLGPAMISLAFKTVTTALGDPVRQSILARLSEEIDEQVELGVVRNNRVIYVETFQTNHPVGVQIVAGTSAPLHCTSTGKLFLAYLPISIRKRMVASLRLEQHTDATITSETQLLAELVLIRKRGWAGNLEEFAPGVVGCAVPILSERNVFVAGLGASIPAVRTRAPDLATIAHRLTIAAKEISQTLDAA